MAPKTVADKWWDYIIVISFASSELIAFHLLRLLIFSNLGEQFKCVLKHTSKVENRNVKKSAKLWRQVTKTVAGWREVGL